MTFNSTKMKFNLGEDIDLKINNFVKDIIREETKQRKIREKLIDEIYLYWCVFTNIQKIKKNN